MPGGSTVPASGVTWVSVAATHRRQGLVTQMMDALHDDATVRGEPIALLGASEGGIYERFGYGIATQLRAISIDRRAAILRPGLDADRSAVRYVEGEAAHDHLVDVWDRYRRTRAGEITRSAAWHRILFDHRSKSEGEFGVTFHLAHRNGYAAYRISERWSNGVAEHRLELVEFLAVTPAAHLDLWHTVLGIDLVATITTHRLAPDEALPLMLTNARAYATTTLKDGLWANVLDPSIAFAARVYGTIDRLVVEVDEQRWAIESDGAEASCRRVRTKADLVIDRPSFGALLFGGVRPSLLARGRRLSARSDDVLRRADAFFVVGPAPHCTTLF